MWMMRGAPPGTSSPSAEPVDLDEVEVAENAEVAGMSRPPAGQSRRLAWKLTGIILLALGTTFILSGIYSSNEPAKGPVRAGQYRFDVGNPGPGDTALPIRLPSTDGTEFDLASLRGKTVLLYFQEGVMCQPCWDQLKEIERDWSKFEALGVEAVVSITSDPMDASKQKVADEGLTTAVLSDYDPMFRPEDSVQEAYQTNRFGMMGRMHSGHTFIVVGPDGKIRWRADYGGAPDFTMYLPVPNLVADMRKGLSAIS